MKGWGVILGFGDCDVHFPLSCGRKGVRGYARGWEAGVSSHLWRPWLPPAAPGIPRSLRFARSRPFRSTKGAITKGAVLDFIRL